MRGSGGVAEAWLLTAADRRALVQEVPAKFELAVDMTYPTTLPLVSVPAKRLRAEIDGEAAHFQTLWRGGRLVDSGSFVPNQ